MSHLRDCIACYEIINLNPLMYIEEVSKIINFRLTYLHGVESIFFFTAEKALKISLGNFRLIYLIFFIFLHTSYYVTQIFGQNPTHFSLLINIHDILN